MTFTMHDVLQRVKNSGGSLQQGSLFADGGEMGALMRSICWEDTPLGAAGTWSPTLQTMVRVLLRNRFPMLLLWGPRFIQLYNDAYRAMLGDKHPQSMGQACEASWPEVWPVLGPMIEEPYRGAPACWADDLLLMINRRGFSEECHFKLAFSPVPDVTAGATAIGGVIAPAVETSDKVFAERQLRALCELGAHTIRETTPEQACRVAAATLSEAARDVPFALFYLYDESKQTARLAGSHGFSQPEQVALDDWPIDSVTSECRVAFIDNLLVRFSNHLTVTEWGSKPHSAVVLPLASPDQQNTYGFIVAGVSPHRMFDQEYRTFYERMAAQVLTAICNASALQKERKRAELLAEFDRAKTTFFANISHEFRTPLTLMLGPLQDLMEGPIDGTDLPRVQNELGVVHRNGMRLLKLVNALLDFSRLEAGSTEANLEAIDLASFTAELASMFRSAMEKAEIAFTVSCEPLPSKVFVDRTMWEKIVMNLLSNAFKFTLRGSIRVRLEAGAEDVRLTVADTGIGMAESDLRHIFERFRRVGGAAGRTMEGTGIGLAMVHELVKLHGGSIQAESTLGRGTTFTVIVPAAPAVQSGSLSDDAYLPANEPSFHARAYLEESLHWLPTATSSETLHADVLSKEPLPQGWSGERILIADDNADMRDYLRRLLAPYYQVEVVADGAAALASAIDQPPDLLLTDLMMTSMDGFTLVKTLREKPGTNQIPVLMLSARAGEEARIEGLQSGVDDYLVKPFSARELLERVRAQLKLAKVRLEGRAAVEEVAQKFRFLAESMPQKVFTAEPNGDIDYFNQQWTEYTGLSYEEIKDWGWVQFIHPEDVEENVRRWQHSLNTGTPFQMEHRFRRFDGEFHWHLSRAHALRDAQGKVVIWMGSNTDIHDQKQAEAALRRSEKLAIAGRMASSISHEINNPLESVTNLLYLIHSLASTDELQCYVKTAEAELARITEIVNAWPSFPSSAQRAPHRTTLRVAQVDRRALSRTRDQHGGHHRILLRGDGVRVVSGW